MRSQASITLKTFRSLASLGVLLFAVITSCGQRLAIVAPERTLLDETYIDAISGHLGGGIKVLDRSLVATAFQSAAIKTPFNMSTHEGRVTSSVIGTEYLLILRSGEQRRASLSRAEYYEAFLFLYLVDGRTGQLVSWRRHVFEYGDQASATLALIGSVATAASELSTAIMNHRRAESSRAPTTHSFEEVPPAGSTAAAGLKPPIPYRRIRPEYTETAFLYGVRATVDADVDIEADGRVFAVRFVRWAGFGLEGSVEKAVRQMNWRPATRNGTPLPMRILLRYNFTKVDKE